MGVPLVYDTHHHRWCSDGWSLAAATEAARATWGRREPLFNISSPLEGRNGPQPQRHHVYIDAQDYPSEWLSWSLTVEVEAKVRGWP